MGCPLSFWTGNKHVWKLSRSVSVLWQGCPGLSAGMVWVQVTAGAGWCKRRCGSLPSACTPPIFSPPSAFFPFGLMIIFFSLNLSSPKPGYNMSLHHIFPPLFQTAISCPAVLMWVTRSTSSCLWEWLSWHSSEVLVLKLNNLVFY